MKNQLRWLLAFSALVAVPFLIAACSKPAEPSAAASAQSSAKRLPIKGVIVDIMADQSALMVKHDEIPGYMMAMTMMFKVDATTLQKVRKGQAITGTLVLRGDEMWLEEVVPAADK